MMRAAWVLGVLLVASSAAADAPGPSEDLATMLRLREVKLAIGVGSPLGWFGDSFGASLSVGFRRHHAIRANAASYAYDGELFSTVMSALAGVSDGSDSGRINDLGLAYTWFPRALWQGLTLEAGILRRDRATRRQSEFDPVEKTFTITYAGRATVGWSWRWGLAYVAIAAGISVGRETGHEWRDGDDDGRMPPTTRDVDRARVSPEGYLRLGLAFGG